MSPAPPQAKGCVPKGRGDRGAEALPTGKAQHWNRAYSSSPMAESSSSRVPAPPSNLLQEFLAPGMPLTRAFCLMSISLFMPLLYLAPFRGERKSFVKAAAATAGRPCR